MQALVLIRTDVSFSLILNHGSRFLPRVKLCGNSSDCDKTFPHGNVLKKLLVKVHMVETTWHGPS